MCNALLKEYVVEIRHYKADMLAAREKNCIFLPEDTRKQLSSDKELKQTEMEEAKKHVEIV
jgi:kinesin family protein 11